MRFLHKLGLAGLGAFGLGFGVGSRVGDSTELVFVSVGQGDCAVFSTGGHAILIDDGPATPYFDAGSQIVVPRLRALGVESVAAILLSHPDGDHVGGTPAVLKAFPEAQVVISDQFEHDPAMLGHLAKWGLSPERVRWLPLDCSLAIGKFRATIVCPDKQPSEEANNGSMFIHLTDGAASAVFSGDAPTSVERAMETHCNWSSEILKAGHHGSRTASDESWIEAVHPRYAIISVGRNNRYGHPNREVMDRLQRDGVQALRTDQLGDIVFDFDGKEFVRRSAHPPEARQHP